jgi:ketosteroid isomerase-like protein
MYSAMAAGDIAPIVEILDPEVEYRNPEHALEPGVRKGADAFRRILEQLLETLTYVELTPERIVESDDRLAVILRVRAEGVASGAPTDQRFGHVLHIREGRLLSLEWFRDPEDALNELEQTEV